MNKMKTLLDELLSHYDVIAIDCGGVLHDTSCVDKLSRYLVIEEMKQIEPLLKRWSNNHILVLVCNSTKKKIFDIIGHSGLGKYFDKMYIGPNKTSKIQRLERVMKDYRTDKIVLLDDKIKNIQESKKNSISAIQIFYHELLYFI